MTEEKAGRALVLLAPGAEEMEVVITVDVLRRGGVEVVVAGVEGPEAVSCSRGVGLKPDRALQDVRDPDGFDAVVLPGGMAGVDVLCGSRMVQDLVKGYAENPHRRVAAICAAALALDRFGVLENRRYTCYPGVEARIESGDHVDGPVVEDGLLLTSQGPGTAMAFALTLLERLRGRAVRDQVALGLLFTD